MRCRFVPLPVCCIHCALHTLSVNNYRWEQLRNTIMIWQNMFLVWNVVHKEHCFRYSWTHRITINFLLFDPRATHIALSYYWHIWGQALLAAGFGYFRKDVIRKGVKGNNKQRRWFCSSGALLARPRNSGFYNM